MEPNVAEATVNCAEVANDVNQVMQILNLGQSNTAARAHL